MCNGWVGEPEGLGFLGEWNRGACPRLRGRWRAENGTRDSLSGALISTPILDSSGTLTVVLRNFFLVPQSWTKCNLFKASKRSEALSLERAS